MRAAGTLGEILSVSRELDSRIVDHALLHWSSDHRREFTGHASVDCTIEHLQDVARVGAIELTGTNFRGDRDVKDAQRAGAVHGWCCAGRVGEQRHGLLQLLSACLQNFSVAGDDELARPGAACDIDTEVRPDACRLAAGQDEPGRRHYILYSTNASSRSRRSHNSVSSSAFASRNSANARWRRLSSVAS